MRPRMSSLAEVAHEVAVPPRPARRAPWGPTTGLTEGSRRAGRSGKTRVPLRARPPEPGRHVHGLDGLGGPWRRASCVLIEGGEERSPAGLRRGGLSAAMFESLLCIALQLAPTKCGGWRSQRCRGDNSILRDFCQLIEQQSNIVPPSGIIWSFIPYREKTHTEHVS